MRIRKERERDREIENKTKENTFGAAAFFQMHFFLVIFLTRKNKRRKHTNILDSGK